MAIEVRDDCPRLNKKISILVNYSRNNFAGNYYLKTGFKCPYSAECGIEVSKDCPIYSKISDVKQL